MPLILVNYFWKLTTLQKIKAIEEKTPESNKLTKGYFDD